MLVVGEKKYYTIQEAGQLIDLTAPSVRAYIKKGKIRAQKSGTRWYIAEENLQEFLKGGTNEKTKL